MAMSRKHYVLIAEAVKNELRLIDALQSHKHQGIDAKFGARSMAISLACALKRDNERFDIDRFYEACGVTSLEAVVHSKLEEKYPTS